jgi:hypothetical protein
MSNLIRVKRSTTTLVPSVLQNAEIAYSELSEKFFIGVGTGGVGGSATSIIAIGGPGAYLTLDTAQTVPGNKTFTGDLILSGATVSGFTTTGDVVVGGNLTVNGTTTTVNSTTVTVDDKNIELGATASPTDAGANGGGITLKGTTDKTFNWIDATDAWTSSEHLDLASGKNYYINGAQVLSSTALGSGVVNSSLTSVGTLVSGTWQASVIGTAYGGTGQNSYTDGQLLIGNTAGGLTKATLTAGNGVSIANGNGSITISATGASYTAGNGLDLVDTEFSLDIKAGSGLVITDTELDLDANLTALAGMQAGAASALALLTSTEIGILDGALVTTAELNIIDGSTSATATTLAVTDRMVVNDGGTMVQVALSDLVAFLENGAVSGFDIDGGTF